MENKALLPEILIASSDKKESARLTALKKDGLVRKIASRVYTSNLTDTDEIIVRRSPHDTRMADLGLKSFDEIAYEKLR